MKHFRAAKRLAQARRTTQTLIVSWGAKPCTTSPRGITPVLVVVRAPLPRNGVNAEDTQV